MLVADDVADTGAHPQAGQDLWGDHVSEVRFSVIYEKRRSIVMSDYAWRRTDEWINFPWLSSPPVVRPTAALLSVPSSARNNAMTRSFSGRATAHPLPGPQQPL